MSDGLTVPFALAAGLSGAVASTNIIVTAGVAEIAAGSIAMGLGGYLAARGEEAQAIKKEAGFKARRWVVERTHNWMNRFRRILVRWEKRADTYIAMLHLACGILTWRAAGLLK
jgi:hypothetical protein